MNSTSRGHRTTPQGRARSRTAVVAFALLGLVQLFVCTVVPFVEARAPSPLGAHIEQHSQRQHYVHDEAYCAACIARHLTGTAELRAPVGLSAERFHSPPVATPVLVRDGERHDPTAARAPPSPVRLG